MNPRVLRLTFIILGIVAVFVAYDQYDAGDRVDMQILSELPALNATKLEMRALNQATPKPLRPQNEALEYLLARLVDDTELLGSSVRLERSPAESEWNTVNHGVTKTAITVSSPADKQAGLGYFAMMWELLLRQPVSIVSASLKVQDAVITLSVDLELLALEGGG